MLESLAAQAGCHPLFAFWPAWEGGGKHIVAIFFDVDKGEILERSMPEEPFELVIFLLYSTDSDPKGAEASARELAEKIEKIFNGRCRKAPKKDWLNIELVECIPIADEALTYAQSKRLQKWSVDHISLKEESQGFILKE